MLNYITSARYIATEVPPSYGLSTNTHTHCRKGSMKFDVILEPEPEGGYTVTCPAVKGAVSYGKTVEEAIEMIKDAIEGILEVRGELEKYAPVEIGSHKIK